LQQISRSHLAPASVSLVVGQNFVRSLCEHCREAYVPSTVEQIQLTKIFHTGNSVTMKRLHELEKAATKAGLGASQPLGSSEKGIHKLWRADPHGCELCDYTGFAADIGIFEVCKPSDHLRKQLADNELVAELQKTAIKDGTISLTVDALIKALRGLIDFSALLSIYADVK
jgi:general secretion pathway protein E